jgi:hypothetical protein
MKRIHVVVGANGPRRVVDDRFAVPSVRPRGIGTYA